MIKYLQCILILFIISSCNDDMSNTEKEQEMEVEQETVLLLKERIKDGVLQLSYEFNADSTLSKTITHDSEGEPRLLNNYTYLGDNISSETILIESGEITASRKYIKQSDTESIREFYDSDGELSYSSTYLFDGNECGYTDIITFDALGNGLPNTRVEFTDENCSSKFYSKYQEDDEYLQWEYTRNDKFDSSNSVILSFFRVEKQRSVTNLVRATADGIVSTNLSYDAIFEYNEDDHPVNEIRTYLDGDVVEYAYTYYQ